MTVKIRYCSSTDPHDPHGHCPGHVWVRSAAPGEAWVSAGPAAEPAGRERVREWLGMLCAAVVIAVAIVTASIIIGRVTAASYHEPVVLTPSPIVLSETPDRVRAVQRAVAR